MLFTCGQVFARASGSVARFFERQQQIQPIGKVAIPIDMSPARADMSCKSTAELTTDIKIAVFSYEGCVFLLAKNMMKRKQGISLLVIFPFVIKNQNCTGTVSIIQDDINENRAGPWKVETVTFTFAFRGTFPLKQRPNKVNKINRSKKRGKRFTPCMGVTHIITTAGRDVHPCVHSYINTIVWRSPCCSTLLHFWCIIYPKFRLNPRKKYAVQLFEKQIVD